MSLISKKYSHCNLLTNVIFFFTVRSSPDIQKGFQYKYVPKYSSLLFGEIQFEMQVIAN